MKQAKIRKEDLKALFEALAERYRIIGPKVVSTSREISGTLQQKISHVSQHILKRSGKNNKEL